MNPITIDVTQTDIDLGVPLEANACAIALAASRQFPNAQVRVLETMLEVDKDNLLEIYDLPEEAASFISKFDDGDKPAPFTFTAQPSYEMTRSTNGDTAFVYA